MAMPTWLMVRRRTRKQVLRGRSGLARGPRLSARGSGLGEGLGLVEVFGLDAEELVDGGAEGGVAGELRVGRDQGGGFLPGQADQVLVFEQLEKLQAGVTAGL